MSVQLPLSSDLTSAGTPPPPPRRRRAGRRHAVSGWAYATPTALFVLVLFVLPVLLVGQMSASDWPLLSGNQGVNFPDNFRDAVENRVGQARERATDTWDKLEKVFEERVQRALVKLGVPSREDLNDLSDRVETLTAELRRQVTSPGGTTQAALEVLMPGFATLLPEAVAAAVRRSKELG